MHRESSTSLLSAGLGPICPLPSEASQLLSFWNRMACLTQFQKWHFTVSRIYSPTRVPLPGHRSRITHWDVISAPPSLQRTHPRPYPKNSILHDHRKPEIVIAISPAQPSGT